MKRKRCHNATIKLNNMRGKNTDKDRWLSHCRSPYERVFSKVNKKARYCGVAKNQFQVLMQSMAHNLKRLIVLDLGPVNLVSIG